MMGLLETGAGYWDPVLMLAGLAAVAAIACAIRSLGRGGASGKAGQGEQFFSGQAAPAGQIKSSNLYWGFFEETKGYYKLAKRMHNGIVNDYVYWLVLVIAVLLAAVSFGGVLWA